MTTLPFLPELFAGQPWVQPLGWTLLHFLWQGTLITLVYSAARALVGRSCAAQARYLLGCAALTAMLAAPITTFCLVSPSLSPTVAGYAGRVPLSSAGLEPANPATVSSSGIALRTQRDALMPGLVLGWFVGATVFFLRLTGGWVVASRTKSSQVRPAPAAWQRTLDSLRAHVRVSAPVRLLVSGLVQVPIVVGWLRPVVLVPVGALAGLPPEHLEALLAHELAHIRRHDYLVNILQGIVEALLFYHPAVWWISNHIRVEREQCCDDVAVEISGDAFTYALALLNLESCRPANFNPALAASGGQLPDRIARVLGVHRPSARHSSGFAPLAVGALILFTAFATLGQPREPGPAFEVASIKPSPPEYVGFQSYVRGDRYTAMTATVRDLISFAYGLRTFQISGGPAWASSIGYNISARMAPAAKPEQSPLMVRSLLAARFALRFHRVTKNQPGYALVVDKRVPRLTESTQPGPGLGHGKGRLFGRGADMGTLVKALAEQLESPVVNRTGLTALYDFNLTWTPDDEAAVSPGPSLFTSLRDQLGLRLVPVKKVPVDVLVIDGVAKPSEN